MNTLIRIWVFPVVLVVLPFTALAQLDSFEDLEEVTKKGFFKNYFTNLFNDFKDFGDPFTMTGGVGLNLRSYNAVGGDARQDPFFYSFNANLNARIYKLNLPFSLLITTRNRESSLPNFREIVNSFRNDIQAQKDRFVRFGMSPQYKWIKFHLGHRSMNFSKFTLSNLNFFGAGMELSPGNWRFAAMYGRLAKAEPLDLSLNTPNLPIYQRLGWGAKFGYETEQQGISVMLFKGHDNSSSINIPEESPQKPSPEDNLTLGLNGQKLFFDKFRLKVDFGMSALSPNALDAETNDGAYPRFLYTERTTSEHNTALDAALDYEGEKFIAGVQFKRIDPNYKSLGAYFFNNDIIDLLGNLNFGAFKDQVNVQLSAGVQSNNIGLLKPTTTTRFIYSVDLSYSKDALSAGINYSNNTTDVGYVLNQNLDSLNAVIITQDAGANLNYTITDKGNNQHIFTLSGNIQEVGDDVVNPLESSKSSMIVGNFVYNFVLAETNWRFTTKANYNQNELAQTTTKRYGAGFGVAKTFLDDKMNFGVDVNYFLNSNKIGGNSTNLNGQFRWSYNVGYGINTNMSWGLLRTASDSLTPFSEVTGNLGLQYTFNVAPFSKKKEQEEQQSKEEAQ